MNRQTRIEGAIEKTLKPEVLEVTDESHRHAGHSGARPEGETHYRLRVVSSTFEGQSRIARHKMIHRLLKTEFDNGLHALSIQAKTPGEANL